MEGIHHIVVLMLENQSFDRILGYLRLDAAGEKLEGLAGGESNPVAPPGDMTPVPVSKISGPAAYTIDPSPGHDFEDVNLQLFGDRVPTAASVPRNNGLVLSYASQLGDHRRPLGDRGREIMACLDPTALPVTSALARGFVICDHWFASVPGPTWPNRFVVHAATAGGHLVTPEIAGQFAAQFWGSPYRMRTIFENLMDAGHTWKVYFDDYAQAFALRSLHPYVDRFQKFEQFAVDVAAGALPTYAFIEPRSFSAPGYPANDQHPPHHLLEGEKLIANVYDTLRSDDATWRQCLLVVLHDEHGGFYDHVPPPAAVRPDRTAASPSGFAFDRLGVRVPALIVSPWVPEGHVDHTVYDHTSVSATLKKILGLPAFLTARDRAANTFDTNFLAAPRAEAPTNLSALVTSTPAAVEGRQFSARHRSLLALAELQSSPPAHENVPDDAVNHARAVLDTSQAP